MLPLSIDGAVLTSSLAMLRAARLGTDSPWMARAMLVASVGATLAEPIAMPVTELAAEPAAAPARRTQHSGKRRRSNAGGSLAARRADPLSPRVNQPRGQRVRQ